MLRLMYADSLPRNESEVLPRKTRQGCVAFEAPSDYSALMQMSSARVLKECIIQV